MADQEENFENLTTRKIGKTLQQVEDELAQIEQDLCDAIVVMSTAKKNDGKYTDEAITQGKVPDPEQPNIEDIAEMFNHVMTTMAQNVQKRLEGIEFMVGGILDTRKLNSEDSEGLNNEGL